MGSGKGQQKRVNLKLVDDLKILGESVSDYNKMKRGFLKGSYKTKIDLSKQTESNKYMHEIFSFMKFKNILFIKYDKNKITNWGLSQDEVDWIESQTNMLGVCNTTSALNKEGELTRYGKIVIREDKIKNEFEYQARKICTDLKKDYDTDWHNEYLDSNRTLNELYNIFKQRIILHEIAHALMPPIIPDGEKQNYCYEEFKAEFFAKKVLDKFYGEDDFHKITSLNYIQTRFKQRVNETNKKQALQELANATAYANVAVKEFFDYLRNEENKTKKN